MVRFLNVFVSLLVLLSAAAGQAEERISLFLAELAVNPDATLTVTERLTVQVTGERIKHGIIRTIPVGKAARFSPGDDVSVLSASLDTVPVAWDLQRSADAVTIRLGTADTVVPSGEHRYDLVYHISNQIGFLDGYDELVWNVTGTGWEFVIDRAQLLVSLPGDDPAVLEAAAFTGRPGESGTDYERVADTHFVTTRPLQPGEGFTVRVGWQKGLVQQPQARLGDRVTAWLAGRQEQLLAGFVVLVAGIYLLLWLRFGRVQRTATIIPRFAPPAGAEPGFVRFVRKMGFSQACFVADLLELAARGVIRIEETEGGFTLRRGEAGDEVLTPTLQRVAAMLFPDPEPQTLSILSAAGGRRLFVACKHLQTDYEARGKPLFSDNLLPWLAGLLPFAGLPLLLGFVTTPLFDPSDLLDRLVFLFVLLLGFILLAVGIFGIRETVLRREMMIGWRIACFVSAVVSSVLGLRLLWSDLLLDPWLVGSMLAAAGVSVVALFVLPARTAAGQRLYEDIEGLALFFATTQREQLAVLHPPEQTPEFFERMLPYAYALDCFGTWADRFASVVRDRDYASNWYVGETGLPSEQVLQPGFAELFARRLAQQTQRAIGQHRRHDPGSAAAGVRRGGTGRGGHVGSGRGGGGGSGW